MPAHINIESNSSITTGKENKRRILGVSLFVERYFQFRWTLILHKPQSVEKQTTIDELHSMDQEEFTGW